MFRYGPGGAGGGKIMVMWQIFVGKYRGPSRNKRTKRLKCIYRIVH